MIAHHAPRPAPPIAHPASFAPAAASQPCCAPCDPAPAPPGSVPATMARGTSANEPIDIPSDQDDLVLVSKEDFDRPTPLRAPRPKIRRPKHYDLTQEDAEHSHSPISRQGPGESKTTGTRNRPDLSRAPPVMPASSVLPHVPVARHLPNKRPLPNQRAARDVSSAGDANPGLQKSNKPIPLRPLNPNGEPFHKRARLGASSSPSEGPQPAPKPLRKSTMAVKTTNPSGLSQRRIPVNRPRHHTSTQSRSATGSVADHPSNSQLDPAAAAPRAPRAAPLNNRPSDPTTNQKQHPKPVAVHFDAIFPRQELSGRSTSNVLISSRFILTLQGRRRICRQTISSALLKMYKSASESKSEKYTKHIRMLSK